MLWEIYALTILNELRSRAALKRFNKSELDITYARAKVKLYVTNCNNGTADIQAIVTGNDGTETYQSYLGINTINPNDLYVSFTVDGSHLVFGSAAKARRHK